MNANKAPLFERMLQHLHSQSASFHVPGHKSGRTLDLLEQTYFHSIMTIDFTEITGLDDLHQPEGAIFEAERLAAACFGAEQTYFLVNGSTVGNQALIIATCDRGDTLLVQRNVHKSVIHGLMLAGAQAVFLMPDWHDDGGIATGIRPDILERAFNAYPHAKGVLITNPNYYGMSVGVRELADIAHRYGKPLLVDEAHGAHFGFHPSLPASALSCGADGVVQSTHKMLSAMTMGAMLHVQGERLDRSRIRQALGMLQSSSPSYPIMASLDISRRRLHAGGAALFEPALVAIRSFRRELSEMPWFRLGNEPQGADEVDPFKILISDMTDTLDGFQLQASLESHRCMIEMADRNNVLIVCSAATSEEDTDMLLIALRRISDERQLADKYDPERHLHDQSRRHIHGSNRITAHPVSFERPGFRTNTGVRTVRLEEAAHERSAESVIPYPPGIPILYPGELITPETVHYLITLRNAGGRFQGVRDAGLNTLIVADASDKMSK